MENDQELPKGWISVQLEAVAELSLGKMLDKTKNVEGNPLPYLRNINVRWGGFQLDDLLEMPFRDEELARYSLHPGDVLICEGGEPGRAAVWPGSDRPIMFQKAIHRARPTANLHPQWLVYHLRCDANAGRLEQHFTGTTIKHFTGTALSRYPLVLPPIAEQRRIVSKLESLLSRSRRAKEALDAIPALVERLRQSVLAAAFRGDLTADWRAQHPDVEPASKLLVRIRAEQRRRWEESKPGKAKYQEPEPLETSELPDLPPGWCWTSLGSLLHQIQAGHSPKALGRPAMPDEPGVLKVSAVSWGEFLPEENKALPSEQLLDASVTVRAGDLLISRANTPELVGAVVLVHESHPNLMLSDKTLRLVPLSADISKEYLLHSLRTHWVRKAFEADATGTSNSMRNLSQEKIRAAPIALAPLEEQQEIARQLGIIFARCTATMNQHSEAANKLVQLEESFLAKAFRGELVPQEQNDEPASTLLERLHKTQAREPNQPAPRRRQLRPPKPLPHLTPMPTRNTVPPNHLKLIVDRNGGRMTAFKLYKTSGLAIDEFYAQLRAECGKQKPLRNVTDPHGSRDVYIEASQ